MNTTITARHTDLTQALSSYIHRKLEKTQRHLGVLTRIQVILSVEKLRHIAEFVVHAPGETFRTQAEAGDLYSAIDLAAQKLDVHLTRSKDKRSDRRKGRTIKKLEPKADLSLLIPKNTQKGLSVKDTAASPIQEIRRIVLNHSSVEDALEDLQSKELDLLPFINNESGAINILYRKGKKSFGLLEAQE